MMEHFRLALTFDPAHVDAAVRLLGHLADAGEWEEYDDVARRLLLVVPDDPRANLFRGLGLHERARSAEAEPFFMGPIALLPEDERRVFEDVSLLLPRMPGRSTRAWTMRAGGRSRVSCWRPRTRCS